MVCESHTCGLARLGPRGRGELSSTEFCGALEHTCVCEGLALPVWWAVPACSEVQYRWWFPCCRVSDGMNLWRVGLSEVDVVSHISAGN